jgi:hypothetical protein
MLADCQSKTFANAGNECEEYTGLGGNHGSIYLARRNAEEGSHTGRGDAPSAWLKVYRTGEGSPPEHVNFPKKE